MSEVVDVHWYNTSTGVVIGIVKTFDEITGEYKFRIGTGMGIDEKSDMEYIKTRGDHFYPEAIK